MSGSNDFKVPCSVIPRLTTLGFNPSVIGMRHDPNTLKHRDLSRLKQAGLLPTPGQIKGRFPHRDLRPLVDILPENDPGSAGKTDKCGAIIDVMGEYVPGTEVIVYDMMCEIVAVRLALDVEVLKRVVAAHEVAHAISHLGTDRRIRKWETFEWDIWRQDIELFAQIYALFCFRDVGDNSAIDVFRSLSDHQSEIYNSWMLYEDSEVEDVNILLFARRLERFAPIVIDVDETKSGDAHYASFSEMEYDVVLSWLSEIDRVCDEYLGRKEVPKKDLNENIKRLEFIDSMAREHFGPIREDHDAEKFERLKGDLSFAWDFIERVKHSCRITESE